MGVGLKIVAAMFVLGAIMGACSQVDLTPVAVAESCPQAMSQAECRNEVYVATNVSEASFLSVSDEVNVIAAELEGTLYRRDDDLRTVTFRFANRDNALIFIQRMEETDYVSVATFKPDVVEDAFD